MTLLDLNVGAAAAVGVINPLSAQLEAALFGSFGLGSFNAELQAQLSAAVGLNATLTLAVSDPTANFQLALAAIAQLQASIQAAMQLGLPSIGIEIGAQLGASAALGASLSAKIGGLSLLIEAALEVKLGALNLAAELQANLSAGPIVVATFGFDADMTAQQVGSEAAVLFAGGLPGILATDNVFGIMVVTKSPSVAASIKAMFKVG